MSPSDLPWWAWMLLALFGLGIVVLASRNADALEWNEWGFWKTVRLFAGLFAVGTGLIGLVRFVNWAWE